jgi:hypothetical protein
VHGTKQLSSVPFVSDEKFSVKTENGQYSGVLEANSINLYVCGELG